MTTHELRFPDGTVLRTAALADRASNADWRQYGLYLDARWAPTWPATVLDWPDLGTPVDDLEAARAIRMAFERARAGIHVEVGCASALGRTGTVVAAMAVLAGVAPDRAITWTRTHHSPRAIESSRQEAWVLEHAHHIGRPIR